MLRPKAPPGGGGGGGRERGGGGILHPKAPTGGCGICSVPRPLLGGVGYAPSQGPPWGVWGMLHPKAPQHMRLLRSAYICMQSPKVKRYSALNAAI